VRRAATRTAECGTNATDAFTQSRSTPTLPPAARAATTTPAKAAARANPATRAIPATRAAATRAAVLTAAAAVLTAVAGKAMSAAAK